MSGDSPAADPVATLNATQAIPASLQGGSLSLSSRVCDNCIRKKVKCDLGRPTCSRCFERGHTCTYSSTRRKPGPPRGSHRGSLSGARPRKSLAVHSVRDTELENQHEVESPFPQAFDTARTDYVSDDPTTLASPGSSQNGRTRVANSPVQIGILPDEEDGLLHKYLDSINDAIPIFSRPRFFTSFQNSASSNELKLILVIITAKLTGFTFAATGIDLDAYIDLVLSSGSLEESMFHESPSLDQYRKACVLAFYEFHQFPGQQAWMRIGKLTRSAYWIGLDRLNDPHAVGHDWHTMKQDDLEDWRLIWWAIYRFDSYANLAVGMPYLADEFLVRTALARDLGGDGVVESRTPRGDLFLPAQPDDLWELLSQITSDAHNTSLFNIHIITATALRYVGRTLRTLRPRLPTQSTDSVTELQRSLSTFRLALPVNFINPMRNAFLNETSANHHARLVAVLHLLMARLLASLAACSITPEGHDWVMKWQQVLETCQDLGSMAEQWSSIFTMSVDPAICFIIFTALVFVDLHAKYAAAPLQLLPSLKHCETALLLQLEQFASTWTLPKLLICTYMPTALVLLTTMHRANEAIQVSFKSFRESLHGPLSDRHIQFILSRFEAPLHPRWLQFLSTAQSDLEVLDRTQLTQTS